MKIKNIRLLNFEWQNLGTRNIIAIVGSTKFKSRFLEISKDLEMSKGRTVLHTHLFSHADGYELNEQQLKRAHSNGHNRIDMSDGVCIISPDLNIGDNTYEELQYAENKHSDQSFLAPIKIATHNGIFHADDIVSVVMILKFLNDKFMNFDTRINEFIEEVPVQIIRTRDQAIIDTCDWVVDVGFKDLIDEKNVRYCFDHHQKDSEYYPNGIKMAACGKLARYLYKDNPEFLKYLQENLLYAIEAQDNGQNIAEFGKYTNPLSCLRLFNCNWNENNQEEAFYNAIEMAYKIYNRIVDKYYAEASAVQMMDSYIKNYSNCNCDHTLVMNKFVPWQETVIKYNESANKTAIHVVVFPALDGGYTCQVVPKELNSFESFVSFPKEWRGLQNAALEKASGIEGAKFCHAAGFLSSWQTLEAAIQAASCVEKN